jgi:hypothetical protein
MRLLRDATGGGSTASFGGINERTGLAKEINLVL